MAISRTVVRWYPCRDEFKGPFSREVGRALKHIKSAVTSYGAHYGFAMRFGYDRKVWKCCTANIFPEMFGTDWIPMLRRHLKRVYGYDANVLGYRNLRDIYRVGQKERAKQNTFGIRNKVESFERIKAKLAEEDPSGQYPVIAMFSSKAKKHYIIHPDPHKYPEMAEMEALIVDAMTIADKKIRINYSPFNDSAGPITAPEPKQPLASHQGSSRAILKRGVKRKARKALRPTLMPARKAEIRE